MYAKVILSTIHSEIDRIFDYQVPKNMEESMKKGMRVLVPFGSRNTRIEGYILELAQQTEVAPEKMKELICFLDETPVFSEEMLSLAIWMKEKYYAALSQCLLAMMPPGIQSKTEWKVEWTGKESTVQLTKKEKQILDFLIQCGGHSTQWEIEQKMGKNCSDGIRLLKQKALVTTRQVTKQREFSKKVKMVSLEAKGELLEKEKVKILKDGRWKGQEKIIAFLEEKKEPVSWIQLKKALLVGDSSIQTLEKKGILKVFFQEPEGETVEKVKFQKVPALSPTPEQEKAIHFLIEESGKTEKKPVPLHGITGSGKTEIYMQVIDHLLNQGKQAIVLVPEISLTPLMVERFFNRFGEAVAVTHSRMNDTERYYQWKKAREGTASIMIGPRSAVFAPFSNLGAIIIDEEQEHSYQSDNIPKYNARETAEKRCELSGGLLILGSATPNLCTYYEAKKGNYHLLTLYNRAKKSSLPPVYIQDMRKELAEGNYSIFSRELQKSIKENLETGMQTILFLNRRGFSTFVSCRKCGHVMTCSNCNVSYTYHAGREKLICHYCGKQIPNPMLCPECGSKYIRYFGTGTQKAEAEIKKYFPEARVLRMDLDTTSKKNSMEQILDSFSQGKADILIGTQMIAKGHDFPKVTLVGVLAADLSLNTGDFKGSETTFQLLTQVAGRAGRDQYAGRVFIQTYQPEHYCIAMAAKQDYEAFYEKEILIREMMDYPPFSHVGTVLLSGKKEEEVISAIQNLYKILCYFNRKEKFQLLGPSPAAISKMRKEYRWRILVKCAEEERLRIYLLYCLERFKRNASRNIFVNLTIDPVTIV